MLSVSGTQPMIVSALNPNYTKPVVVGSQNGLYSLFNFYYTLFPCFKSFNGCFIITNS